MDHEEVQEHPIPNGAIAILRIRLMLIQLMANLQAFVSIIFCYFLHNLTSVKEKKNVIKPCEITILERI